MEAENKQVCLLISPSMKLSKIQADNEAGYLNKILQR